MDFEVWANALPPVRWQDSLRWGWRRMLGRRVVLFRLSLMGSIYKIKEWSFLGGFCWEFT